MPEIDLQQLCEVGQRELMETRYLEAAKTLTHAEQLAWQARDFDTLARLYLPLQEATRQIRQRCGEGAVHMHLLAEGIDRQIDPEKIVQETPCGQLLVGGWGSIQPAIEIRRLAASRNLYLETFLAALYPGPIVVIVPWEDLKLPDVQQRSADELRSLLPTDCLVLSENELPVDSPVGNAQTFAGVMGLWEQLHTPLLNAAVKEADPIRRMQKYRDILRVDPACELAHQFLAQIARNLVRSGAMVHG